VLGPREGLVVKICVSILCVTLGLALASAAATAQTAGAKPAATPGAVTTAPSEPKQPSPAQLAQQNRMKTCAAKWDQLKAANKAGDRTYQDFSKECLRKK
jgi:3-hydroxyisobutyrate dehydrogenase-like beta-hydroxyacid dehydrogenase